MQAPAIYVSQVGFIQDGPATLLWGTAGILGEVTDHNNISQGSLAGYILKSLRSTATTETLYVENGSGMRIWRAILDQGREYELTVVNDTTITPPAVGYRIFINDPQSGLAPAVFICTNPDANANRKSEGERVIRGVFDNLIDTPVSGQIIS